MHGWNENAKTMSLEHNFVSDDGIFTRNSSEVKSTIENNNFNAPYIPLCLYLEFDVIPQFSLALFGQYKHFPLNISHTPTGIWTAGAGIRINFVGKKQGIKGGNDRMEEMENQLKSYSCQKALADTVIVEVPVLNEVPVVKEIPVLTEVPVAKEPVIAVPPQQPGKLLEVDKPLSHFAVQIFAFRVYKYAPDNKIFFNDNPTIYRNGDLRRYVVFTGTLEEAKIKWYELRKRYHDAFIVYIDDDGVFVPYHTETNTD